MSNDNKRIAQLERALRGATEHLRECGTEFAATGNHIMQAGCYAMADQIEDAVLKEQDNERGSRDE